MRVAQSCWGSSSPSWEILHSVFTLHLSFMQWVSAWVGLVSVWETTSFSRGPPKKGAKLSTSVLPVSTVGPASILGVRAVLDSILLHQASSRIQSNWRGVWVRWYWLKPFSSKIVLNDVSSKYSRASPPAHKVTKWLPLRGRFYSI